MKIEKSKRLQNVSYAIRGTVNDAADRLERQGEKILKLNIGNPAAFGFETSSVICDEIALRLKNAQGYCNSQGLWEAREAIKNYVISRGVNNVTEDDIYLGNGASELITMTLQALLNSDDEVLIPAPDYPLWTASVNFASGKAVHYICDEASEWNPDVEDMRRKITSKTKAIVLINPNNPTGSVYSRDTIEKIIALCAEHSLILLSDEIYDRIVYDGKTHISAASISDDIFHITFNGFSKVFMACGFRLGWMVICGNKKGAEDFMDGIKVLSSMRLCSNVIAQTALKVALEKDNNIKAMVEPGGRLYEQREAAWKLLNDIPGISCVKPSGSLYMFPKIDAAKFGIKNDEKFILDLLNKKKILFVQGTGFNWPAPDHFRVVFLPTVTDIEYAMGSLKDFLSSYQQ